MDGHFSLGFTRILRLEAGHWDIHLTLLFTIRKDSLRAISGIIKEMQLDRDVY
jgi:DNA helicase-2/ATP-dependent DNA helicase PcrA